MCSWQPLCPARLKCVMPRLEWSSTRLTRMLCRAAETGCLLPTIAWLCVRRPVVIDSPCRTDWTGCRWVIKLFKLSSFTCVLAEWFTKLDSGLKGCWIEPSFWQLPCLLVSVIVSVL